jgi:tetratricopeptide (TPR) repeat protein
MTSPSASTLAPVPQTGRQPSPETEPADRSLWAQILAVVRDLSGAFDALASDPDPEIRTLGRRAAQRRPPHPNDYLALGDRCARRSLRDNTLDSGYAAKTIAAYTRAAAAAPHAARAALLDYAGWIAHAGRVLGGYEALSAARLVCERVAQLDLVGSDSPEQRRLLADAGELRERLERLFEDGAGGVVAELVIAERQSRLHCDEGQMQLRQSRPDAALAAFDRALAADEQNQRAWLWRALALTDLGRFDEALASYDRALALDPNSAGGWNSKGALLLELGRLAPALDCFERALVLSPDVSTVKAVYWLNAGKALYMLGRYQQAREALAESHRLEPTAESAAGLAACDEQLALAAKDGE